MKLKELFNETNRLQNVCASKIDELLQVVPSEEESFLHSCFYHLNISCSWLEEVRESLVTFNEAANEEVDLSQEKIEDELIEELEETSYIEEELDISEEHISTLEEDLEELSNLIEKMTNEYSYCLLFLMEKQIPINSFASNCTLQTIKEVEFNLKFEKQRINDYGKQE